MSYFLARTNGEGTKMWVHFTTKESEIHFGYIYKGDFYYVEDDKHFTQPLSKCKRLG